VPLRRTSETALYAFAAVVTLVSVARPFVAVRYPAMTDLPFHAASASAIRHYWDPSFHFADQFELHPLEVPYLSSYVLMALLMTVMPPLAATKIVTVLMLLMLPIGLGTLTWGMRKSPLLGLAALPFVWGPLTHWGFVNFVAAIGLLAATLGLTLRVLDRPTRRSRIALGGVLVLLFFTHVFRLPFALLGVLSTTLAMFPVTRRVRPVLLPLLPSAALLALFLVVRPPALTGAPLSFALHGERMRDFASYIVGSFNDNQEIPLARSHLSLLALTAFVGVLAHRFLERWRRPRFQRRFARHASLAVGLSVALALLAFLALPMEIGVWWYVFPREATVVAVVALALLPDLPRALLLRAGVSIVLAMSSLGVTALVTRNWSSFDVATRDFERISHDIQSAPKLCYLVFDHRGATLKSTAFIHLPAYIQAERGGWLSFHFASFGASPLRYRVDPDAVVPPPTPRRWEWTPKRFRVEEHGPFFDTFLVRDARDPSAIFRADPSIDLVAHEGSWWLFRRTDVEAD
jgi:hypothetical protein